MKHWKMPCGCVIETISDVERYVSMCKPHGKESGDLHEQARLDHQRERESAKEKSV